MADAPFDPKVLSVADLLGGHVAIHDALRRRGVLRSANAPTGDLAEWLFCGAMEWARTDPSVKGHDAVGTDGTRYEVKSVRMARGRRDRQVSALRSLDPPSFDVLAGLVFDHHYAVELALLIPVETVKARARHRTHTNSATFHLRDDLLDCPGVVDVTSDLHKAWRRAGTA